MPHTGRKRELNIAILAKKQVKEQTGLKSIIEPQFQMMRKTKVLNIDTARLQSESLSAMCNKN